MGLEQIAVGFLMCCGVMVGAVLLNIFISWLNDDEVAGGFMTNMIMSLILGVCLTYILYMKGWV